jgi:tetratricopeptide (TPR) repeat protein
MARKKKKGGNQKQTPALSTEEQREKGYLLLRQEKYREALSCFKQLLKQGEDADILQALQQAYAGRIESLAAKSMIKEAMAMLETMVRRFPNAAIDSLKLSLLLQSGNFTDAARFFRSSRNLLEHERLKRLEVLFGALLLADVGLRTEDFDQDLAVVRHYPLALQAMEFFFNKEDKVHETLQKIPFRSPYRDLRILLTGQLLLRQDKEKAREILEKIEKNSPYFQYAGRCLAAVDSPEAFLRNLAATPTCDHNRIRDQYNLNPLQLRALDDLSRAGGNPLRLFQMVRKHGHCFNKDQKAMMLRQILPFCREHALDTLAGSSELSLLEKYRILALAAEKDTAFTFAVDFWNDYLDESGRQDPAKFREIAMVMRHQAKLMTQSPYDDYYSDDVLETMLQSLEYDHSHARTWLDAAEFAKRHISQQEHYSIISTAAQKLPGDVTILVTAMRACGNRGAHKKASGLAKQVLKIDPINTSALDFLVESRLQHGRKLASRRNWTAAEKELQGADTRVKAIRLRGRNHICLGMLLLLQGNEEGLRHIAAGRQANGFFLLGHILTSLESRLFGLTQARHKKFDQELRRVAAEAQVIDSKEFLTIINWLSDFDDRQWSMLKETCQCLKKYFSRGAAMPWSPEEGLSICKALDRAELEPAAAKCARNLHQNFPDDPLIEAWYLITEYGNKNKPLPMHAFSSLHKMLYELEALNHYDLADRIDDVLRRNRALVFSLSKDEKEDDEDFLDDELFKLPPMSAGGEKSQPKAKPSHGRQLNLFEDDL